ncbi:MAG: hypothetical protein KDA62_19890, partial [Planctomycetales bacterium]|nr:hypothetical protein [Planctomycetales bacterium]
FPTGSTVETNPARNSRDRRPPMNSPDKHELLAVYRAMYTARQIDHCEQQVTNRGEAFFHVSGSGHEATAALAPLLKPEDWLHCHYRDKALLVARGLPLKQFFDNLYCKRESSSAGRRMSAFFSDPELHVLSMVTPTGNNALQSVGVAQAVKPRANRPIVMCAVGDGTTQQGEFLEGIAEAARGELPVLFVIEDNHWAISTPTAGRTFYSPASSLESAAAPPRPTEFHGVPIHFVDGRDPVHTLAAYREIVTRMRDDRRPAIVVLEVDRLTSHTNTDDQSLYRPAADISRAAAEGDSIQNLRRTLLELDVSETELAELEAACRAEVAAAEEASAHGAEPITSHTAKRPLHVELTHPARERRGEPGQSSLTMRDALRSVLKHHLATDDRVSLLGEDIEDPKGDVFGVTRGLSTEFPGRVVNSPLTESTIMGVSIGRSRNSAHVISPVSPSPPMVAAKRSACCSGVHTNTRPSATRMRSAATWWPKQPCRCCPLPCTSEATMPPRVTYLVPGVTGVNQRRGRNRRFISSRDRPASAWSRPVASSNPRMRSASVVFSARGASAGGSEASP